MINANYKAMAWMIKNLYIPRILMLCVLAVIGLDVIYFIYWPFEFLSQPVLLWYTVFIITSAIIIEAASEITLGSIYELPSGKIVSHPYCNILWVLKLITTKKYFEDVIEMTASDRQREYYESVSRKDSVYRQRIILLTGSVIILYGASKGWILNIIEKIKERKIDS